MLRCGRGLVAAAVRLYAAGAMMKIMVVGQGGRESSLAAKLAEDSVVYAALAHENPGIVAAVEKTGGRYRLADINDGNILADFALEHGVDYVFVNCDGPLAAGVVDTLLARAVKAVGPTRAGARIEWDKIYSMAVMARLFPRFTPFFRVISRPDEVPQALREFADRGLAIVVKPQGLTGGKGVKVMGKHLQTHADVERYACELLAAHSGEQVLLTEKLEGLEFTLMGITDGQHTVYAPASYDYPYRYEHDRGPGTGGMGCFTDCRAHLPFMTAEQYSACTHIMDAVIRDLREQGVHFNGVLNGGFFLTAQGLRFMEFNGRFGDPEAINVLAVLQSSFADIIKALHAQTLAPDQVVFARQASVVKYLVAPAYPESGDPVSFELPLAQLAAAGLSVAFSAAVANADSAGYRTVSSSRVVAITCVAPSVAAAAEKINRCIEQHFQGGLDYRADIGSKAELERLQQAAGELRAAR